MRLSLFISLEGGEGSGKSTQVKALKIRLEHAGANTILVREPGSTPLGDYLRTWLKSEYKGLTPHAELFMFAAARSALVLDVIKPALAEPEAIVISDRFCDSTTAYQGYGRRIPLDDIEVVNRIASCGLVPDLTILLDCPPSEGLRRVLSIRSQCFPSQMDGTMRFEHEELDFHERVRQGYHELVEREPERWHVVDASQTVERVGELVWERIEAMTGPVRTPVPCTVQQA